MGHTTVQRYCAAGDNFLRVHACTRSMPSFVLLSIMAHNELDSGRSWQLLTDYRKSCGPQPGRRTFMTNVSSFVRLVYVMYGQDTGKVVDRFHKSLII